MIISSGNSGGVRNRRPALIHQNHNRNSSVNAYGRIGREISSTEGKQTLPASPCATCSSACWHALRFWACVQPFLRPSRIPRLPAAPQDKKPHPPLAGKACVDCHKQNVSSTVRCLVAKEPLCVLCHDIPDVGGTSRLVNADSPLCFKCHAKEKFKSSFNHGPFVFGACVACHDPHGGNEPRMLRISGRQLCLTCHRDMDTRFTNARFRHQALANGCTDCHSPHSSEQHYELKAAVPALCAKCHEKTLHDQETAEVKHSPVTEAPACMNCHNPHLSENDHLLLSEEPDTCLRCHDEPIKIGQK